MRNVEMRNDKFSVLCPLSSVIWLNEKRTTVVYKVITAPTTYTTKEVVQ
jgi:hypothetical protein